MLVALAALSMAALLQAPPPAQKPPDPKVDPRIYEDEERAPGPKEYSLNPHQAKKEVEVGDFYMKRGSFSAAIHRFEEASKWDPKWAIPWRKIGEAYERQENPEDAIAAYRKFLELAPKGKLTGDVRRRIKKLEATIKTG